MAKILIIEDEKPITELLEYNLKQNGYFVEIAHDGEEGLQKILDNQPDLVILDLMLPKMDGMEICRRVKGNSNTQAIPIVMLTAKTDEVDRIVGLEMGADDYVTKPFSVRELILRIKAILKRADGRLTEVRKVEIKELSILPDQHVVYVKGEEVELTHLEFNLLLALVNSHGRVLTRDTLLNKVWGYDYYGDTRTVDVHVRRLRQKLGAAADYVKTIRGTGYKFNAD
jgi:two-component system alkaline phosphatase synthesis response regulator PhoP